MDSEDKDGAVASREEEAKISEEGSGHDHLCETGGTEKVAREEMVPQAHVLGDSHIAADADMDTFMRSDSVRSEQSNTSILTTQSEDNIPPALHSMACEFNVDAVKELLLDGSQDAQQGGEESVDGAMTDDLGQRGDVANGNPDAKLLIGETNRKGRNALHEMVLAYIALPTRERVKVKHKVIEIVSLLVRQGLDINAGDVTKQTPMHVIATHPDSHDIKVMLACGAKVNGQDCRGQSPLHLATARGHVSNVECLVECGADPNAPDASGRTALHVAAKGRSHLRILQFLLRCGGQVGAVDLGHRTPLHVAAKHARPELVGELLHHAAAVNQPDAAGLTAVHLATTGDLSGNVLKELLKSPADVNVQDYISMETPLHKAITLNMLDNFKVLCKARADPNIQDIRGETPLHRACHVSEFLVWNSLMRLGGDVNIDNEAGLSPVKLARNAKNYHAIGVLAQYAALE